ncbi:MAG: serine/threonine protein kinase [Candidatus Acidiferrales bacterium]
MIEIDWGGSPGAEEYNAYEEKDVIFTSSYADDAGRPGLRIWRTATGSALHMEYYDGVKFWVTRRGRHVWIDWPETSSKEDAATYFLGPVLGLLLRFRGVTCLHASAVAFRESAVAFVGPEGAGKSTLAAAFARGGYAALSDDIVALSESGGGFLVQPAYPFLSLWEDSTKTLFGSADALPVFSHNYEKRCFSLKDHESRFADRALPLGAIYLLGDRSPDAAPRVEPVPSQEAFLSLVANTYATDLLDIEMRAREFEVLGRLLAKAPVRKLIAHQDPARCFETCEAVQKDFETLQM